jgi:hypothetical protein
VGLSFDAVSGPSRRVVRIWSAACDGQTDFSSIAKVNPMIAFARISGITTVHLRGPETQATTATCPSGAEFFGAELRIGAYLPMFPPTRIANLQDGVLPTLPDGRILIDNRAWEMPTPQNLDVFVDHLERAGLLVFDPLVEELRHVAPSATCRSGPRRAGSSGPSGCRDASCRSSSVRGAPPSC